jgi:hypothetical protein
MYNEWKLPRQFGEGGLFGFSGLDGATNTRSGFVAAWGAEPHSLLIQTRERVILSFKQLPACKVRIVTGDVHVADSPAGMLAIVYNEWHTIIGRLPEGASAELRFENGARTSRAMGERLQLTEDPVNGDYIALITDDTGAAFAVAYGTTADEAVRRAEGALGSDLGRAVEERLRWFERTPQLADEEEMELLQKCMSVMKVNSLQAEGAIRRRWSTPNRVPHKDMWLWDSVFHSFAMNQVAADIARDYLLAVLEQQQPGGMIPHQAKVTGERSSITQPPILAWGVWENYTKAPDVAFLRETFPVLESYLIWNLSNRDANGNGLFEWKIDAQAKSRSGESGMDNSPRFDQAVPLDAVDFSTFMALEMKYMSLIASKLGHNGQAVKWSGLAKRTADAVVTQLWHDEDGFFYDKALSGDWSKVKASSGFLPLLLEELPDAHVDRLILQLHDPESFGSVVPVPSVSVSDPAWGTDMWRGPVWINYNYMIWRGLQLHGREKEAERIRRTSIALVNKYYRRFGVIFEYFDASDELPPPQLDRKGKSTGMYNFRIKFECIRDFHWAAALTACFLLRA